MLCLDGEGPSRLTTFDIKWPMSMKESSWMIPTARTSPWLTWSPSWQWKKNKPHQVVTMMQSSPEIAWERIASNYLGQADEPADDSRTSITSEEFMKMTRRLFAEDKMADVLACLKRSLLLLIGQHAVYLRLPSQDPEGKVHRIKVDDLHKDLLAEKDNPLYSKYKLGIVEYGPQKKKPNEKSAWSPLAWKSSQQEDQKLTPSTPMRKSNLACTEPFLQCICLTEETETLPQMKRLFCHLHRSSSQTQLWSATVLVSFATHRPSATGARASQTDSAPGMRPELEDLACDAKMAAAELCEHPEDVDCAAYEEAAAFMHEVNVRPRCLCRSIVPYSTVWSTRPAPCLWKKLIVIILCRLHGGCLYQHQLLKVPCVLMLAYLLCNFSPCLYSLLLQSWKRCWFLLSSFMARKFKSIPGPQAWQRQVGLETTSCCEASIMEEVKIHQRHC